VRRTRPSRDPLEPIASTVGCLIGLTVLFVLLSLLVHQAAWGDGPVCTSVPADGIPLRISGLAVPGQVRGSQAAIGTVQLCVSHPGTWLRLAGLLASWPAGILWLGCLFQVYRLLATASRPGGLYSLATAARARRLGWFLTAGALAAGVIETVANLTIFLSQVHYPGLTWFEPDKLHLSVATLLAGLALITLARVMRVGVTMREELDVTV
jgi:Protein of unknown function (DUF2975)